MNDHEMRKEFEQMLGDIDVRMFLKASPHASGERSKLDKSLSSDMFYNSLYANSEKADDLIAEIQKKIIAEDTHNFILSGYKGCGKSTFIGYFLRNIDARSLVIKFDDHWEPSEGIYQNIVMFLYEKIFDDILPENNEIPCLISDKYIEIFYNNMNGDLIEKHIDLHKYFTNFTEKLEYAVRHRRQNSWNKEKVKEVLNDHIKKHIKSGSISNILMLMVFWDIADRIVHDGNRKCCIVFENLDVIHNTKDVPKLVENVVAFRNNIDRITASIYYKDKPISDPSQDYIMLFVMRETTRAEFLNSVSHFSDGKIRFEHFMAVSEIYDLYDIISKKYDYLESIKDQFFDNLMFCNMMKTIESIKIVLTNPTIRRRIFAFFNNDFRTSVEALEQFNFSDIRVLAAHNRLIDILRDDNWPTFACRSIIYRCIFNIFVKDIYFERVRKYEYSISDNGKIGSINLDRMILLYLNNSQNILVSEELKEKEYVPLNILYMEVLKFCNKPETIIQAIWNMYDMQNTQMWNHLVTFDDMQYITLEELRHEMNAVIQEQENVQFAKIKITLAGQMYLSQILPHFEYYAARSKLGEGYSLFCLSSEELCEIHKIEDIIKQVKVEVSDCCKRLFLFFKDVFNTVEEFKDRNFLDTKFASIKVSATKKSVSRMYHGEKVIYSNIGYLDHFRFFIFYSMDQVENNGGFETDVEITDFFRKITHCNKSYKEILPKEFFDQDNEKIILKKKAECQELELHRKNGNILEYTVSLSTIIEIIKITYNKSLVDLIIEYMKLFGLHSGKQITAYSGGTEKICQAFDACINYKIIPSKYKNFDTPITYDAGEKIQAEINRNNRQIKHIKRQQENREKRNQNMIN